jgi:hypothetical protein
MFKYKDAVCYFTAPWEYVTSFFNPNTQLYTVDLVVDDRTHRYEYETIEEAFAAFSNIIKSYPHIKGH